ncbi:CHAT domain-containing protein [Solwaraspora sp. WMMB335]|uniref:CHAT domain-containing protein n=1 Tax=Solwaraspora sp. WMMB335 TaxID=3404118 RepID=UPI003B957CEB
MTQVISGPPAGPDGSDPYVARCLADIVGYQNVPNQQTLDVALASFAALRPESSQRPKLAAVLAVAMVKAGMLREPDRVGQAVELAGIADTDPAQPPQWRPAAAAIRSLDLLMAARDGRPGFDPHNGLAEVRRFAAMVGGEEPYATMIESSRLGVELMIGMADSDSGSMTRVTAQMRQLVDRSGSTVDQLRAQAHRDQAELLDTMARIAAMAQRGDAAGALANFDQLYRRYEHLPANHPLRLQLDGVMPALRPVLRMSGRGAVADPDGYGRGAGPIDAAMSSELGGLALLTEQPGLSDAERASRLATLAVAEQGLGVDDPAMLSRAIGRWEQVIGLCAAHDPRRPFYLLSAGVAHLSRLAATGRREDLHRGIDLLEQAQSVAAHAYWTMAAVPLAHAYRLRGQYETAKRTALSGLRGHAWNALLQPDPVEIASAARFAAQDAVETARWCLSDGDAAAAATALDAGRGLMLYSAAETRELTSRLTGRGETRLAEQWRQAMDRGGPLQAPADLRRQVIAAVAGVGLDDAGVPLGRPADATTRLLDPPGPDEVRAALAALDADALVYLVPGEDRAGAAVIVSAGEAPTWCKLPELSIAGGEFERLAAGMAGHAEDVRSRRGPAPAVREMLATGAAHPLDAVCEWAWRAAIGPLLALGPGRAAGRPLRLVLVPMRELASIPWHAAYRLVDGRRRYAIEDAVFSYTVSARLLCETAAASDVALTGAGLIVGDPDTIGAGAELLAAREEAAAIRAAYYPAARYVGRTPDGLSVNAGTGSPGDVLEWLAGRCGSMMHLACHGVVRKGASVDGTSYLLLAGGQRLAADELLRSRGGGPVPAAGLAVLAACRSGASVSGYDEAFSLGTALLAAGVRSVVSAQWSVPDDPTSVLMFMFHHYLRIARMRPLDALRAAQLWMLDGGRQPPKAMPPTLRWRLDDQPPALAAWAGFTHSGR